MPSPECLKAAQIVWDYLKLDQPLMHCDCIIAMGSHDLRVGEHAAKLMLEGWGSVLVCSGGHGRLTANSWNKSEAAQFAEIAIKAGIPSERILIEDQSTNTGENISFSRDLLAKNNIKVQKVLLVHKPYMERRALATAQIAWPQVMYCVSSPPIPFKDYPTKDIPLNQLLHIMVGDFQRVLLYPQKGYQMAQAVPDEAMEAFNYLVKAGFTQHIIHGSS